MKEYGKGGGSMSSVKGMCSYKSNPMPKAKMTEPTSGKALGSPANPDQAIVRKLRAKAYMERDSLRGANGI
jgi:hypothetical protein